MNQSPDLDPKPPGNFEVTFIVTIKKKITYCYGPIKFTTEYSYKKYRFFFPKNYRLLINTNYGFINSKPEAQWKYFQIGRSK